MKNLIAQIDLAPGDGYTGFGPLGNPSGDGIGIFSNFLSSVIGVMTIVAIIWFVFVFIAGAIGIIAAGGDKGANEAARKKITTGITGLVIVIIATFAIDLIGYLLGFGSGGILNLQDLFSTITGGGINTTLGGQGGQNPFDAM